MRNVTLTKKNKDGKEIVKSVPENVASIYVNTGWKVKEENGTVPETNKEQKEKKNTSNINTYE